MGDENKKTVRFVFIGRIFNRKGETAKLNHLYVPLDKIGTVDEMTEPSLWFSRPLGSGKRSVDVIGGIYEGEITTNLTGGMTAHNTGRWQFIEIGPGLDQETIVQLKTQDGAQEAEYHAFQATKKAKKDDPMYEALAPIREAYRRSSIAGRRAILAKVLAHIGS